MNHSHVSDGNRHETLRLLRTQARARAKEKTPPPTLGQRISDAVAASVGSWKFILIQSLLLALWITANVVGYLQHWDPYPFILLNLFLSFQAAYTAPFIMMSQNRQAVVDRYRAQCDYDINLKAELEIEMLHEKIDLMREQEVLRLTQLVEALTAKIDQLGQTRR